MTIDKSLRRKGRLERARNVLKRSERIEKLEFEDRWEDGQSPFGPVSYTHLTLPTKA